MDLNVKVTVPAIEKLVDYAASGIGAVAGSALAPWKAEREAKAKLIEAKAEADSQKLIADARAEARESLLAPYDTGSGTLYIGREGIEQRIEFQEKKRQANIVSVVHAAAAELEGKEVPNHEPDPDWTARFFDSVQDVSSDDMQKLWAKVLSGEVEAPGRTSLRTLDILKNMTKKDAELFSAVCDYVIDNYIYYPFEYQLNHKILSFVNMLHLEEIGLLRMGTGFHKSLEFTQEDGKFLDVPYQNSVLRISKNHTEENTTLPIVIINSSGKEIYSILDCVVQMDYLKSFSKFLRDNNCELSRALIIARTADREIKLLGPFTPIEPEP